MNVAAPRLAAHLDRCWDAYRDGLLVEVTALLPGGRTLFEASVGLDPTSRGNAQVELDMLGVIASMVAGTRPTDCLTLAATLAERATEPNASCDGLHRVAALASGVHAAMRNAAFSAARARFEEALVIARGLNAEGGEPGVSLDDVCAVVGCAGLNLAGAAAAVGAAPTTLALLEHSALSAAELGREHHLLGQYFGPEHVAALRCICLATLQRYEEALEVGHGVATSVLIPLVHATLLRTMAEASDRLERGGAGDVLRAQADAITPPLRRQFGAGDAGGS